MSDPKVIVALDFSEIKDVTELLAKLDPKLCRVKVGKELFTTYGPDIIEKIQSQGFEVFLDLKFHDIPNTVAKACQAAARMGVWMVNVHALGGRKMLTAAREAVDQLNLVSAPKLIAVTILTSMRAEDITEMGLGADNVEALVVNLAKMTKSCGFDGVVCSAKEGTVLRSQIKAPFDLVTPGIRLADDSVDDQVRVLTPDKAIEAGASYLVVGRSITRATDPALALEKINKLIGL